MGVFMDSEIEMLAAEFEMEKKCAQLYVRCVFLGATLFVLMGCLAGFLCFGSKEVLIAGCLIAAATNLYIYRITASLHKDKTTYI
jgi:hypothetical protein